MPDPNVKRPAEGTEDEAQEELQNEEAALENAAKGAPNKTDGTQPQGTSESKRGVTDRDSVEQARHDEAYGADNPEKTGK